MSQLVEFPLEDAGSIIVQVNGEEAPGIFAQRLHYVSNGNGNGNGHGNGNGNGNGHTNGNGLGHSGGKTFEEATANVTRAAQSLITRFQRLHNAPDEIVLDFGIKLTPGAGAIVASSADEANFKVSLSWKTPIGPKRRTR
jgi:hypothetical protein